MINLNPDPMKWTDKEVLAEMKSETSALNKARAKFYHNSARIEQAEAQRTPLGPIERRRMEFKATVEILEAYGIPLEETFDWPALQKLRKSSP